MSHLTGDDAVPDERPDCGVHAAAWGTHVHDAKVQLGFAPQAADVLGPIVSQHEVGVEVALDQI